MDKKSPSGRRTKRQNKPEDNHWDCSVCTYKNTAEAFKCLMCDVRKGTSTRKPRINPQLVSQQFNPAPSKSLKRDKDSSKKGSSDRHRRKRSQLRKLRNVDRSSAETQEVTVNNVTVTITEYRPIPESQLSSESESANELPNSDDMLKLKLI